MKIKPASKKALKRAAQRKLGEHWWLADPKPRKMGRLSQLNKKNKRTKSEFIKMVEVIEND